MFVGPVPIPRVRELRSVAWVLTELPFQAAAPLLLRSSAHFIKNALLRFIRFVPFPLAIFFVATIHV